MYLVMQEPQGSDEKLEKKLKTIMSEVDTLKNEVCICVSLLACMRMCNTLYYCIGQFKAFTT